jgi:GR25 family glycosyltransferase involved in LPS biosynthesis
VSAVTYALYVINLDRSPERWQAISDAFSKVGDRLVRVPAIDATADPEAVLAARGTRLARPPNGLGWDPLRYRMHSLIEEATFASHLAALRAFLVSGHSHAVVMEDDAVPRRPLRAELEEIVAAEAADIVKLEGIRHVGTRLAIPLRALATGAKLVRSFRPSSGAAAYLVTRPAAERLIAAAGRRLIPFDDYLNAPAFHGCRVAHVSPWLIVQSGDASTMTGDRRPIRGLARGGLYRGLVAPARRIGLRLHLWWAAVTYWRPHLAKPERAPW